MKACEWKDGDMFKPCVKFHPTVRDIGYDVVPWCGGCGTNIRKPTTPLIKDDPEREASKLKIRYTT